MGTHISKVKSIDLDSWTDEQIQSMVDWGNAKANTYWEHNLPQNHVPDESKIQNFIRTKYELKKWVASKHIPDPSTIAAGDQLATVNNILVNKSPAKQALENHHDLLNGQAPLKHVPANLQSKPLPNPLATKENTPAKASLLDLNFGGPDVSSLTQPQQQQHPSINSGRTNRPDLKKSILALYSNSSSAPASNTQLPQPAGGLSNSLAGLNLGASPSGLAGSAPPSNVWNSSPNILDASASQKKSAADDDLFKNVWS